MATRRCYICGRESSRRTIAEPLLLPVCLDRECGERASQLPRLHCTERLPDGRLCGAVVAPQLDASGRQVCTTHARALIERRD